jgi:hypothetical protein
MDNFIVNISIELDNLENELSEVDLLMSEIESGNEAQIEAKFFSLFERYKCNPAILTRFLTYLQINNSPSIEKYNSFDIKKLFDKSCEIYTDVISLQLEKYFYYYNILDEEKAANNELRAFIRDFNTSDDSKKLNLRLATDEKSFKK